MAHIAERIMELRQADRPEGGTWDRGWYDAITAATTTARGFENEPDPLRDLAEWLVAREELLPEVTTTAAETLLAEAIIRARQALGRKEG